MIRDARYVKDRTLTYGKPEDDAFRQRHFDICRALNMTSMSIVLEEMVKQGLHPDLKNIYMIQCEALLKAIVSENNRISGV